MEFLEKLDHLMEQKGLNKHTLAQRCGVPYTTIVGLYERGKENARLSTLNRLCEYFDVPLDYLALDKYEKPEDFVPQPNVPAITCTAQDEIDLVNGFRSLNAAGRKSVMTALKGAMSDPDYKKESSKNATA